MAREMIPSISLIADVSDEDHEPRVLATEVLRLMAEEVKDCNIAKGWYDGFRTFGDDIALLHSEVSEMLEAFRITGDCRDQTKPCPRCGDKGWYVERTCSDPYGEQVQCECTERGAPPASKPEGVGSEAADVLVRLLDTCHRYNIDLFAEWRRKVDYNWTRTPRHGGKAL